MKFINHKTLYALSGLILFLSFVSLNADAKSRRKPIHITQKDRARIIESILRKELSKKDFAKMETYHFIKNEYFSAELVPEIYKDKIEFVEQEEVQKRAFTAKSILTFSFGEFKVKGSKVIVKIGYSESYETGFTAEYTIYEYKRISNRWVGWATKGGMSIGESFGTEKR